MIEVIGNPYDRVYDVGGKLLNGVKSVYVNSLAYLRVKGGVRVIISELTVV